MIPTPPPTKPPPWFDPDPLDVTPEPVPRAPFHGWESARDRWASDRPISHRCAWVGLAACVAVIATVIILLFAAGLDAAPSSGQTTAPIDMSRSSSAALSGVPQSPIAQLCAHGCLDGVSGGSGAP